jgi:addiction module HigA family antidote
MWDKGLARHAEKFADKIIKATSPPPLPGEWIRKRMDRLNITQDNLANMAGISRVRVNEIVNGKRTLTADSAVLIGNALGCSAESLMSLQVRHDLYQAREKLHAKSWLNWKQPDTMTVSDGTICHIHGDMRLALRATKT